jgi:hypothetical protein
VGDQADQHWASASAGILLSTASKVEYVALIWKFVTVDKTVHHTDSLRDYSYSISFNL